MSLPEITAIRVKVSSGLDSIAGMTFIVTAAISLDSVADQAATVGTAYSQALPAATGGSGTITYSAENVPDGMTYTASTRTISGTPTIAGTYTIRHRATAADGGTATVTFDIVVAQGTVASTPHHSVCRNRNQSTPH